MLHLQKVRFKAARRARRVRKNVSGTAERPRLSVHRTLAHLYAQVIDDVAGRTLVSACTTEKEFKAKTAYGGNNKAAIAIGQLIAERAKAKGIAKVVFDRGGFPYHGRVKAVAEAARKSGLSF
ncbi:MAG: 50S ribosomal protein L18 [Planctomycetes bacterium]|nr:50S ribosomal protein L18 [Planctomycetota bacterium]